MKLTILLASLCLVATARAAEYHVAKPNIILIYSDDHGYADLGVQGSVTDIRTPNLDALARDGVRFKRGYVSAPQCVPSRAGVMTGRYQQRFGVEDNTKGPLPLEELTIAERLKPAGYVSCQIGKWHLTPPPKEKGKGKGGKAGEEEGEAQDVEAAGAPVPKEQRSGVVPAKGPGPAFRDEHGGDRRGWRARRGFRIPRE